jgi:hypothetical protein
MGIAPDLIEPLFQPFSSHSIISISFSYNENTPQIHLSVVFIYWVKSYHVITMNENPRDLNFFDQPAVYSIRVRGRIDPTLSARLEGMVIHPSSDDQGSPATTLEGEINDQSALAGVLNTLYELHLPVLSVERMA